MSLIAMNAAAAVAICSSSSFSFSRPPIGRSVCVQAFVNERSLQPLAVIFCYRFVISQQTTHTHSMQQRCVLQTKTVIAKQQQEQRQPGTGGGRRRDGRGSFPCSLPVWHRSQGGREEREAAGRQANVGRWRCCCCKLPCRPSFGASCHRQRPTTSTYAFSFLSARAQALLLI